MQSKAARRKWRNSNREQTQNLLAWKRSWGREVTYLSLLKPRRTDIYLWYNCLFNKFNAYYSFNVLFEISNNLNLKQSNFISRQNYVSFIKIYNALGCFFLHIFVGYQALFWEKSVVLDRRAPLDDAHPLNILRPLFIIDQLKDFSDLVSLESAFWSLCFLIFL